MFCMKCGKDLGNDGKKFCPACGTAVASAAPQRPVEEFEPFLEPTVAARRVPPPPPVPALETILSDETVKSKADFWDDTDLGPIPVEEPPCADIEPPSAPKPATTGMLHFDEPTVNPELIAEQEIFKIETPAEPESTANQMFPFDEPTIRIHPAKETKRPEVETPVEPKRETAQAGPYVEPTIAPVIPPMPAKEVPVLQEETAQVGPCVEPTAAPASAFDFPVTAAPVAREKIFVEPTMAPVFAPEPEMIPEIEIAPVEPTETSKIRPEEETAPTAAVKTVIPKWIYAIIAVLAVACVVLGVLLITSGGSDSKKNESGTEEVEKTAEELLIGKWEGDEFDITFTKSSMRFSEYFDDLGGNKFSYEVEDDETLYLVGGDFPDGISITFSVSEERLKLKMFGDTYKFTRES